MGLRVLVVDDEDHILRAVGRALFGFEVVAIATGEEALARIKNGERFDAVIADVRMPGVDGEALVRGVAAVSKELSERVLFLTGDPDVVRKGTLANRPVLAKPFETQRLRSQIEMLIKPTGVRRKVDVAGNPVPESDAATMRPPREGTGEK
ncbi:MAG TPA: response regulator [Labilithrix sp.]|jgi:DNA-binding response OmpR family regulator